MPESRGFRVRRVSVPAERLLDGKRVDYADSFEVVLEQPDAHPAEQWVRVALEQPVLRGVIVNIHRHVLRFRLGPDDTEHVIGWRIVMSTDDVLQLATGGPVGSGIIVARRTSPTTCSATTFIHFDRPAARRIWSIVGPLHRALAPYLLGRAAQSLTRQTHSDATA